MVEAGWWPHFTLATLLQCTFSWYIGSKVCQDTKLVVGSQVIAKPCDSNEHVCNQG